MEENNNIVECQVTAGPLAPVVNPIEEFKLKIKAILDESTVLSRRVNEVAWQQKQKKERDFIQSRRAIERIRMAI